MSDRSLRMLQGCPHSYTIRIPCEICVEARINALSREALLRGADEVKSQSRETIAKLQKVADGRVPLEKAIEKLAGEKSQLLQRIASDAAEIKRLRMQVQDMAADKYAEQASKLTPVENLRRDDEAV